MTGTEGLLPLAAAFLLATLISLLVTPFLRDLSLRRKVVDLPGARKIHDTPTPRIGGIAILIGFITAAAGVTLSSSGLQELAATQLDYVVGIFAGSALMAGVGLFDDLVDLGPKKKLVAQIGVASLAFACGFRIEAITLPFGLELALGGLSYPVTTLWIVGIINAVNLIDGLDGLAAGIGFLVLALNVSLAVSHGDLLIALVSVSLAGAIVGFLRYNVRPSSIFMGDTGSMVIGYVLAVGALRSGQTPATTVALLTPAVAMAVPILDTLAAIVRRLSQGRSPFSPDYGHVHHRLVDAGLSQGQSVLVLYLLTALSVAAAALLHFGLA